MVASAAQLFDAIDNYFLASPKPDYFPIFAKSQRQVEGWFKGELLYLFSTLERQGLLSDWESEAPVAVGSRKKHDFRLTIGHLSIYLELKTLYHGQQRSSRIDLGIYFYKDTIGIWPDVEKLASLQTGQGFCLLFVYPAPERKNWEAALEGFAKRISPIQIEDISDPDAYPASLYIAKLKVVRGDST